MYQIKNWQKFQHFKDRRPPWIKLYRDLLEDPEYFALNGESAKYLILLWLLASEDKEKQGYLPDIKTISFRLHMNVMRVEELMESLSHYILKHDDIKAISQRYQDDTPETETEGETEKRKIVHFDSFWDAYGYKKQKQAAVKAWKKMTEQEQLEALKSAPLHKSGYDTNTYRPLPATWLNGKRWEDEELPKNEMDRYEPDPLSDAERKALGL